MLTVYQEHMHVVPSKSLGQVVGGEGYVMAPGSYYLFYNKTGKKKKIILDQDYSFTKIIRWWTSTADGEPKLFLSKQLRQKYIDKLKRRGGVPDTGFDITKLTMHPAYKTATGKIFRDDEPPPAEEVSEGIFGVPWSIAAPVGIVGAGLLVWKFLL